MFEGTNERSLQTRRAPHLVRPIPFLVPIYKGEKPALAYVDIGLWIYDALAMFRSPKLHKTYRGKKVERLEPALRTEGLRGALEYYDCVTDDARLVLENVLDASALGADVFSYTGRRGVERDSAGASRRCASSTSSAAASGSSRPARSWSRPVRGPTRCSARSASISAGRCCDRPRACTSSSTTRGCRSVAP